MLTIGAVILWLLIGIPIGMISAVKTGSLLDRLTMGVALVFISAPVYFFGLVALFLFDDSIGRFPLLPASGAYQDATNIFGKAEARGMMNAIVGTPSPWSIIRNTPRMARGSEMRGRDMDGWLRLDPEAVDSDEALRRWAAQGVAYARSLPPK